MNTPRISTFAAIACAIAVCAALSAQEVDGVAGELAARGVTVYRVGAGEDLAGCLHQPFASAS